MTSDGDARRKPAQDSEGLFGCALFAAAAGFAGFTLAPDKNRLRRGSRHLGVVGAIDDR